MLVIWKVREMPGRRAAGEGGDVVAVEDDASRRRRDLRRAVRGL